MFAFPRQRKEPLTDASHVKNALARFDQVEGVSDADRELAFANIKKAAAHYGVELRERAGANSERAAKAHSRVESSEGTGDKPVPSHLSLPAFF